MTNSKRTYFFLLAYLTLGIFTAFSQVIRGVYDSRKSAIEGIQRLDGEWEFYWGSIDVDSKDSQNREYTEFPLLWNDHPDYPEKVRSRGVATYRMKIVLPSEQDDYALFVDDMYCAYELYVNDQLVAGNGKVAVKPENYEPEWKPQIVTLENRSGVLELELLVANFSHSRGGVGRSIHFGKEEEVRSYFGSIINNHTIIAFLFFFTAAVFFFRYVFTSFDNVSLYFSIFCIIYGYRLVGADLYILQTHLIDMPWWLQIRLEYFAFFASPLFFAMYTKALYPDETSTLLVKILIGISLVCCTLLVFPPAVFTKVVYPYLVILLLYFFYGFTVYVSAIANQRTGAIYGIISAIAIFSVFTYSVFVFLTILGLNSDILLLGYLLFLFFQSMQVYRHSRSKPSFEF